MQLKRTTHKTEFEDIFGGPAVEIPMLSSGEVTEILGIKMWRLERFLENYPLSAGQPGKGLGSRRLFSPNDVYRLALAKWLLDDKFEPKCVAEGLEDLSDVPLVRYDDDEESYLVLFLERNTKSGERTFDFVHSRSGKAPSGSDPYYVLDLGPLIAMVDLRIKAALEKRSHKR